MLFRSQTAAASTLLYPSTKSSSLASKSQSPKASFKAKASTRRPLPRPQSRKATTEGPICFCGVQIWFSFSGSELSFLGSGFFFGSTPVSMLRLLLHRAPPQTAVVANSGVTSDQRKEGTFLKIFVSSLRFQDENRENRNDGL